MNLSLSKWYASRGRLLLRCSSRLDSNRNLKLSSSLNRNFGYLMTQFLAVIRPSPPPTHKYTWKHTVVELVYLAQVQNPAMKSAWESSGGPEQDTETEREKEAARGCWAQIKFHCLFACPFPSPSPYIPSSLPSVLPFLGLQEPKGPKLTKAYIWGQGCVSVIAKSPYDLYKILHFSKSMQWKVNICQNSAYERKKVEEKKAVLPRSSRESNHIKKKT